MPMGADDGEPHSTAQGSHNDAQFLVTPSARRNGVDFRLAGLQMYQNRSRGERKKSTISNRAYGMWGVVYSLDFSSWASFWKMCSMGRPKRRAILKASGRLGSYLPVSSALSVWRETPS